jgi:NADH-quinone oxidoreductase subunit J
VEAERMPLLVVLFLILGAVGLYLALPGASGASQWIAGGLLLAGAGGALVAVVTQVLAPAGPIAPFLLFALVGLFAALRVITHTRPVYSALYFVLLVVAVTGLLLLMQAEFLAAALVIVYGGAILVTYLFVIMLAQRGRTAPYDGKSRDPLLACFAGFVLLTVLTGMLLEPPADDTWARSILVLEGVDIPAGLTEGVGIINVDAPGTVEAVGTPLLTHYIVAIQIIGIILLAAMVGAIAIARRQPTGEVTAAGEGD